MVIRKATKILLVQTLSDNLFSLSPDFCCDGAELRASWWAETNISKPNIFKLIFWNVIF